MAGRIPPADACEVQQTRKGNARPRDPSQQKRMMLRKLAFQSKTQPHEKKQMDDEVGHGIQEGPQGAAGVGLTGHLPIAFVQ